MRRLRRSSRTCWTLAVLCTTLCTVGSVACTVTDDQEMAIGRSNADSLNAALPLLHDSSVTRYITALGDRIASRTTRRDLPWTFYVVNTPAVNAFALPGGFIYVNRGLIEATSSEAELAGALAHEIGHVIERHAVKQMQSEMAARTGLSMACSLTHACKSDISHALIELGSDAAFARYSRHDEAQADSEAVENTFRAGIDPRGVPALFEKLLQRREQDPTPLDGWFSDHPLEETRIRHSQQLIASIDPEELLGLEVDSPDYRAMKRQLRQLPEPPLPQPARDDSVPETTDDTMPE